MKKVFTIIFFVYCLQLQAQTLEPTNTTAGGSSFTIFQGKLFCFSNDGVNGEGLYYIDELSNNLHFVKSIIGASSNFIESGGKLFFVADDGSHGKELWVTNGSNGGTKMVKDIAQGLSNSLDNSLTGINFQNKLFFVADDGINGSEIWVSDGDSLGTALLKDIYPGSTASIDYWNGAVFTVYNNALYFFANDGTLGKELWSTDGSGAGTNLVTPLSSYYNEYSQMTVFNNKLWFTIANSDQFQYETYIFDTGGGFGLYLLSDWADSLVNKSQSWLVDKDGQPLTINGKIIVGAEGDYYVTDGTAAGTQPIITGLANNNITEALVSNSKLYFVNYNNGTLYATDLTNTVALAPGISNYGAFLNEVNSKVCFRRSDSYGGEPWITDGTAGGTSRLKDINPGSGDGIKPDYSWHVIPYNGNLYFEDAFTNSNLWRTDGSASGTYNVSSQIDTFSAQVNSSIVFNGCLYLNAYTRYWFSNDEIWKFCDGTTGVNDILEASLSLYPNPASNQLFIQTNGTAVEEVNIYNTTGSLISQTKQPQTNSIDIRPLANGIYIAEIKTKEASVMRRWVKM